MAGRMAQALPEHVVTVREPDDVPPSYTHPTLAGDMTVVLEAGETVIGRYTGELRHRGGRMEDTQMVVTDRRTTWVNQRYVKGGGWVGFGLVGGAVALTANAVSMARAASARKGRAAVGQARHEWIIGMEVRRTKALIGVVDSYLDLIVAGRTGPLAVEWWFPRRGAADEAAAAIATSFSRRWLEVGRDLLDAGDAERLTRYASGGFEPNGKLDQRGWLGVGLTAMEELVVRTAAAT